MPEHELVDAREYTPDGQRHCDGCGGLMGSATVGPYSTPNGWGGEVTMDTGTIIEWRISVKASPFRGEDLCRECVDKVASVAAQMARAALDR